MKLLKISTIFSAFLFFIFLTSFTDLNPPKNVKSKTCTVGMFLKDAYHCVIHSISWNDNDETYIAYNIGWDGYFSSYFDATSDITIVLKLPVDHPSGSMRLLDADNGDLISCVNISTTTSFYSLTLSSPVCNHNYVVALQDNPC